MDTYKNRSLADLILSTDVDMRRRLSLVLVGLLLYLFNAMLGIWAIDAGFLDPRLGWGLLTTLVVGPLAFYGLIRSGYSQRFRDPALVLVQCLFCVATIVWGYAAVRPDLRGAVLAILPLVFMFGQFTLRPRQIALIGRVALAGLFAVLGVRWLLHAQAAQLSTDFVQLIYIGGIMVATSRVAQIVSRLRNALERSRADLADALARMQDMATRDELTGLSNRRRMIEMLGDEIKRERRRDEPLSIALLDLDHFKRVNDTHGHQAGDEVLRGFAQAATASLREMDTLARWGGEEFLLLCPGSTAEQAAIGLTRLRSRLADQPLLPGLSVTFSAGTAQYRPGESIEQTVERADQALYQAKEHGRNRTVQSD